MAPLGILCAAAWASYAPPAWVDPWAFAWIGWVFANWFAYDAYLAIEVGREFAEAHAYEEGRSEVFYNELQEEYRRQEHSASDVELNAEDTIDDVLESDITRRKLN